MINDIRCKNIINEKLKPCFILFCSTIFAVDKLDNIQMDWLLKQIVIYRLILESAELYDMIIEINNLGDNDIIEWN